MDASSRLIGLDRPTPIYDNDNDNDDDVQEMLKPEHFALATTEIFGPFYVYTRYKDQDLPLGACPPTTTQSASQHW